MTGTQTGDASTTHYEFETVKYSPAGSRIWTKVETNGATKYFTTGCTFDLYTSKLYVTDYRYNLGTGTSEIVTVKY